MMRRYSIKDVIVKDENGNYIYDNLPEYEYVNCTYDTYRYVRKTPTSDHLPSMANIIIKKY